MGEKAKEQKKPDVLTNWVDDFGWYNVNAYNNAVMGYRTPNINRIAMERAVFADWYGQRPMCSE